MKTWIFLLFEICLLYLSKADIVNLGEVLPGREYFWYREASLTTAQQFDECATDGLRLAWTETKELFQKVLNAINSYGSNGCKYNRVALKKFDGNNPALIGNSIWVNAVTDTSGYPFEDGWPDFNPSLYYSENNGASYIWVRIVHPDQGSSARINRYRPWSDVANGMFCSICERFQPPPPTPGPPAPSTTPMQCVDMGAYTEPPGSEDTCPAAIPADKKLGTLSGCYWLEGGTADWEEARGVCEGKGGRLANILSADLHTLLAQHLLRGATDKVWIGHRKDGGVWRSYPSGKTHPYLPRTGDKGGVCGGLSDPCLSTLTNAPCTHNAPFLCQSNKVCGEFEEVAEKGVGVGAEMSGGGVESSSEGCAEKCVAEDGCVAFGYDWGTRTCELVDTTPRDTPASFTHNNNHNSTLFQIIY